MKKLYFNIFLALIGCLLLQSCHAQSDSRNGVDREPYAAGRFYPSSAAELEAMLNTLFDNAVKKDVQEPLAIIVPHAGYVFSGEVSATMYKLLNPEKQYKHIFLIGSSHTMYFNGASIYTQGDFITPLGRVKVDELAETIVEESNIITNDVRPHQSEHSLEVQLPFLQYWMKKPFSIIPIILGGESESNCKKLAKVLAPYLTKENLFVISTDFSHYPAYNDAIQSDNAMADAILSNSTEKFSQTRNYCENRGTDGLVTAMCGWTSVYTLLSITENMENVHFEKVIYRNSGDSPYGEKGSVVGYYGIALTETHDDPEPVNFSLSDSDKEYLLHLARKAIEDYLSSHSYEKIPEGTLSGALIEKAGAFVTLTIDGNLRGCIGNFNAEKPLYQTVQEMAIAAATQDPRFLPVEMEELSKIKIEISVLTPLRKIDSIDEFVLGKHGIYIKKGNRSGTFLPQVADGTGWTKEEFLGHCARDKAGIGWEGWKDADLYVYEAIVFSEHGHPKKD
jgi:AmmeMemoRadiSam system protein B/AmmeMemoRadiSam system protein A